MWCSLRHFLYFTNDLISICTVIVTSKQKLEFCGVFWETVKNGALKVVLDKKIVSLVFLFIPIVPKGSKQPCSKKTNWNANNKGALKKNERDGCWPHVGAADDGEVDGRIGKEWQRSPGLDVVVKNQSRVRPNWSSGWDNVRIVAKSNGHANF